jgi:hypothetical protein
MAEWKASLSSFERLMDRFLPLFARLNPPRPYTRNQVEEWIARTAFKDYTIEEYGTEMRIKLKKTGDPVRTKQ